MADEIEDIKVIIVIFDLCSSKSFEYSKLLVNLFLNLSNNINIILIANKSDLMPGIDFQIRSQSPIIKSNKNSIDFQPKEFDINNNNNNNVDFMHKIQKIDKMEKIDYNEKIEKMDNIEKTDNSDNDRHVTKDEISLYLASIPFINYFVLSCKFNINIQQVATCLYNYDMEPNVNQENCKSDDNDNFVTSCNIF